MSKAPPGGSAPALLAEGARLQQAGYLGEAEQCYRRVLALNPRQPDALNLLGLVTYQRGAPGAALDLIDRAIGINRRQPHFHLNRGSVLMALGRVSEAIEAFRKATSLDSKLVGAHANLGLALLQEGRIDDGVKALRRARQLQPQSADLALQVGNALAGCGRLDEAEAPLREAHARGLRPARLSLARVILQQGRADEALALAQAECTEGPDAAAWEICARALQALGREEEAVDAFRKAMELTPTSLGAATGLGGVLSDLGRHEEAEAVYRLALASHPRPEVLMNLGFSLMRQGRYDEAVACMTKVLAVDPENANAANTRGAARLLAGDLANGLPDYEARWRKAEGEAVWRHFPMPQWQGGAVDGRLLVWGEQGIGDQLLYCRFLTALEQRGVTSVVEVDPRLRSLIARSRPRHQVVAAADPPDPETMAGDVVAQVPMASLLLRLGVSSPSQLPPGGRLMPDAARVQEWRAWLDSLGPKPCIGLSWQTKRKSQGMAKSLPLAKWAPILGDRPFNWVVLQYGDVDREVAAAEAEHGCRLHLPPGLDRFNDLEGLTALIAALDLTITTSNVTAHLAGGLDAPALVLLERVPLWYWGGTGAETMFYPSVHAIRQPEVGKWGPVIDEVAAWLDGWVGG